MFATFEVDEGAYLKYAAKAVDRSARQLPVFMGLANEPGFPRKGAIEFVDNRLDPQSGTIRVRAVFDNSDGLLTPGMFARLKFGAGEAKPAVLIDDRAVATDQSKKFVFVVGADNKVAYREVRIGPVVDGLRVVRDGLSPGEQIVVNGLQRVRPGVAVAPTVVQMEHKPELAGGSAPAARS